MAQSWSEGFLRWRSPTQASTPMIRPCFTISPKLYLGFFQWLGKRILDCSAMI
ncbi:MAG: hypothetical protein V7L23_30150 [Nostoc sp.]|uniref:hypothetical protein n=1 Tax=Nostoc sp. TaxID=1180 RepID=UPI002FEFDE89